jgi:hypothetical protein
MSNKETGELAFPVTPTDRSGQIAPTQLGMTLRQYAAIKLKVPNSGMDWLDAMIEQSLRDDFAAKAMQAAISGHISYYGHESNNWQAQDIASYAYEIADAMPKARNA